MALLNYTTTVSVDRTLSQITKSLLQVGARGIALEYDNGHLIGLEFAIPFGDDTLYYRLPCRAAAVREVLKRQRVRPCYLKPEHVQRVAWRILSDWIAAQVAIIETEMVTLPQVMLPYMRTDNGQTVFERYESGRALPGGRS